MPNQLYQKQKEASLLYSKNEINRAARNIRHGCDSEVRERCIEVIQNFREVHLYPLMLIKNHLARVAYKIDKKIIIARRLKRLPTIINKLERPTLDGGTDNAIQLTRMQDIGGCRAIVKDLQTLNKLKSALEHSSSVHHIIREQNYLNPKASGYGGIHLIYSCYEGEPEDVHWKRTKIEVQLRTSLQHAWATSLEIIDTLEQIELKTSHTGHDDWRRFFHLAGRLVAHSEGCFAINDSEINDIRKEFSSLNRSLEVTEKLARFTIALSSSLSSKKSSGMILVTLTREHINKYIEKVGGGELLLVGNIFHFKVRELDKAIEALNDSEKDKNVLMSVLLSASDVKTLTTAYPNFFGSTNEFTAFINKQCRLVQ